MTRDELMLAALAAAGENATLSPVQVQKLFFLIDRELGPLAGGPFFDFQPYDYGPFDRAVYDALSLLEMRGMLESRHTGRYRVYALSPTGYIHGSSQLETMEPQIKNYIEQLASWIKKLSFQQLVAAIYNKYPDMKVNSVFQG